MIKEKNETIYLSPSKLNLFEECSLCFWLSEVKGIHRPEIPSSTLPRGMDKLIKEYFDRYRQKNLLPPEIEGKVRGKLISDQFLLGQWRSNFKDTHPRYFDKNLNAVLFGALDECLVDGQYYIPVDYKTRGFDLKADSLSYYQTQLDCYTLLLEAEGLKHLFFGYLIYYIPLQVKEDGIVKFKIEVKKLETNPQRAKKTFEEAVKLLRGPKPSFHSDCKFCCWGNDFLNLQ